MGVGIPPGLDEVKSRDSCEDVGDNLCVRGTNPAARILGPTMQRASKAPCECFASWELVREGRDEWPLWTAGAEDDGEATVASGEAEGEAKTEDKEGGEWLIGTESRTVRDEVKTKAVLGLEDVFDEAVVVVV